MKFSKQKNGDNFFLGNWFNSFVSLNLNMAKINWVQFTHDEVTFLHNRWQHHISQFTCKWILYVNYNFWWDGCRLRFMACHCICKGQCKCCFEKLSMEQVFIMDYPSFFIRFASINILMKSISFLVCKMMVDVFASVPLIRPLF